MLGFIRSVKAEQFLSGTRRASLLSSSSITASSPAASVEPRGLSPAIAMALEPRFMFDAAGAATAADNNDQQAAADAAQDAAHNADGDHQDTQTQNDQAVALDAALADVSHPGYQEVRAADPSQNDGKKEVVFIEDNVADYQTLIDGVKAGVEVVVLDSSKDGLAAMADWAASHTGYDAIHIISHGAEGQIDLGGVTLDTATAMSRSGDLTTIGGALTESGDILLYGCSVASGTGESFIETVAGATGADVAASNDLTGATRLGADWTLEVVSGTTETALPLTAATLEQYDHTLITGALSGGTVGTELDGPWNIGDTVEVDNGSDTTIDFTSNQIIFTYTNKAGSGDDSFTFDATNFSHFASVTATPDNPDNITLGGGGVASINTGGNSKTITITGISGTFSGTLTYTFVAVPLTDNTAPVNTVPGAQSVAAGATLTFNSGNSNAISVVEDNSVSTVVSIGAGTLTATTGGGASITGNGSSSVTILGTQAQVNAALSGLTYTNSSAGAQTLTITSTDGSNNVDTDTVAITVTAPSPTVSLSVDNATVAENAGASAVTVTATLSAAATADTTVTLSPTGTATGSGTDYTLSSNTITITAGQITGTATIDIVNDTTDEADETIILDISGVSGGDGASESGTQQQTVTITDDDAAPTVSIANVSLAEGNSGTSTMTFTATLSEASGKTITVDYATSDGSATAGSDYVAASGTLTFNPGDTTKTFTVTINGDTTTETDETFTATLSNPSNATLGTATASGTITNDENASPVIGGVTTTTTIDDTATTSPFSNVTISDGEGDNVTVTVTLDTAAKGAFTAASLTASGFTDSGGGVYSLASGTAGAAQTAIRQLVFDPTNNRVAAGSTEVTTFTISVNDGISSAGTDNSTTVTSTSVNDAPTLSTPTAAGFTDTAAENSFSNDSGTLSGSDADPSATLTYGISGGSTGGNDMIGGVTYDVSKSGTYGTLYVVSTGADKGKYVFVPTTAAINAVSADQSETFTVTVSDGSLSGNATYTVNITGANDTPTISSNGGGSTASVNVAENSTAVTTVVGADRDTGASLTYSLSGGADQGKFSIDSSTGVLTFQSAPDRENPTDSGADNVYDVQVQVSDGTLTVTQDIAVTVTDVNDNSPVITSDSGGASASVNVAENTTAVTTVTATDADSGASLTYSISGGADQGKFSINSSTGVLTFQSAPNFESPTDSGTNNVYDVEVTVSDGTNSDVQTIAVTVTNANEAPVGVNDTGSATEAGGTNNGTAGSNATGNVLTNDTDVDASDTKTVTAVRLGSSEGSGTAGTVGQALTGTYGSLTLNSDGSYTYVVNESNATVQALASGGSITEDFNYTVSDGGSLTDTAVLTITINGANDAPTAIASTSNSISPSDGANATAASITGVTDVDNSTWTFTIQSVTNTNGAVTNTNGAVFDLGTGGSSSTSGAVATATIRAVDPSALTLGTYTITVRADDGAGGTFDQAISVTVSNNLVSEASNFNTAATDTNSDGVADANNNIINDRVATSADNTIVIADASHISGSTINGVGGTNTVQLQDSAGTSFDFTTAAQVTNVQTLLVSGPTGTVTVTVGTSTGLDDFTTYTGRSGATDILTTDSDANLVGKTFTNWDQVGTTGSNATITVDSTVFAALTGFTGDSNSGQTLVGDLSGIDLTGKTLTGLDVVQSTTGSGTVTFTVNQANLTDLSGLTAVDAATAIVTTAATSLDVSAEVFTNIDTLSGTDSSGTTFTVDADQLGSGKITSITGNGTSDVLVIKGGSIDLTGVTLTGIETIRFDDASVAAFTIPDGFTGTIEIGSGQTVTAADASSLGNGDISIDGGTLKISGGTATLDNAVTVGSNGATIQVMGGATDATKLVSGSGLLTKSGSGSLTLSYATGAGNTHTGGIEVTTGTLVVTGGKAIADTDSVTISGTGKLQVSGDETIGVLTGSSGAAYAVTIDTAMTLTATYDSNATMSGVITGSGGFTKAGSGTLTLDGANTFTGATTVSAGEIRLSGSGSRLADTTAVTVASGATFRVTGAGETVGSIAGAGTITFGANTLTVGGDTTSTTFSGTLGGSGGFIKQGTGTLTLSGASSVFTGILTINAGVVLANNDAALGTTDGKTTVASGAALWIGEGVTIADDLELTYIGISNTGAVKAAATTGAASATSTLSGSITLTGSTGTHFGADSGRTLAINGAIDDGVGALNINKVGDGTVILSNTNTYNGSTTVTAGTLLVTGSLLGTTSVSVLSGGTLGGSGTISAPTVTVNEGAHLAPGTVGTAGKLTISGNLVMNGTMKLDLAGSTAGTQYDQVAVTGTVTLGANSAFDITYTASSSNNTFVIIDNDGSDAITGTLNGVAEGGTLTSNDRQYQTSYAGGTNSNDVTLKDNSPPTFTSTAVTAANEDSAYTYTLAGTDSDGDTVVFSGTTLPGWLSLSNGVLSGTPTVNDIGANSVVITASDGKGGTTTQSFTITVASVNDAPVITSSASAAAAEDTAFSHQLTATDEEGNAVTYAATGLPGWLSLSNGVLSGTPAQSDVGTYTLTITATDGGGASSTQTMTVTVAAVNDGPQFTSSPPTTASRGAEYAYAIQAADPDDATLTVVATSLPPWLSVVDGVLRGTPGRGEIGSHTVVLRVSDAAGASSTQSFTITVVEVNEAPVISTSPGSTATEGVAYTYTVATTDPNGDVVTVRATTLPSWLSFDGATLSGTPSAGDVGTHQVTLVATDAQGSSVTQGFTITVSSANTAPTFTSTASGAAASGSAYAYTPSTTDAQGDAVTLAATTLPSWLSFTNGVLSGTPSAGDAGVHTVVLTATDAKGASSTQSFTIAVSVTEVNVAPTFTSGSPAGATAGSPMNFAVTTADANPGDTRTITGTGLPGWLTLTDNGNGTATLSGTPATTDTGSVSVTLTVRDAAGATSTQTLNFQVGGTTTNITQTPTTPTTNTTTTTTSTTSTTSTTNTGTGTGNAGVGAGTGTVIPPGGSGTPIGGSGTTAGQTADAGAGGVTTLSVGNVQGNTSSATGIQQTQGLTSTATSGDSSATADSSTLVRNATQGNNAATSSFYGAGTVLSAGIMGSSAGNAGNGAAGGGGFGGGGFGGGLGGGGFGGGGFGGGGFGGGLGGGLGGGAGRTTNGAAGTAGAGGPGGATPGGVTGGGTAGGGIGGGLGGGLGGGNGGAGTGATGGGIGGGLGGGAASPGGTGAPAGGTGTPAGGTGTPAGGTGTPAGGTGTPAGGTGTPAGGTGTPAGGTGTPAGGAPTDAAPADGAPADGAPTDGAPANGTAGDGGQAFNLLPLGNGLGGLGGGLDGAFHASFTDRLATMAGAFDAQSQRLEQALEELDQAA